MKSLVVILLLSVWLYALPSAINEEIRKSGIAKKEISIYIKEAGKRGKVIASLNADKTRTPASVIKVFTTYAAALKLGFDYRWPTQFYKAGNLTNGVLHGDLVIKGFGDPTLNAKDLETIVNDIRAKGIRQITGDIVIDRSYFQVGDEDSSGFDQNLYSAYNAMPDAMMFNERVVTVCVNPKERRAYKKHADESYKVVNQLEHVNKPCRGRYSWPGVSIDKSDVTPVVLLKGKISKQCGQRNICKVITKPYKSFYYALKEKMNESGIAVRGTLKLKKVPGNATMLFTHFSEPLEKIISTTSKDSNNLYARHLMLHLGAQVYGAPATLEKGRDAIVSILKTKGALGRGTLKIDNGSGLSRISKMSARQLGQLYDNAYDHYGVRWMETLSIAGIDGTMKRRFRHTVVSKKAWMKTGTIKRVKNIGGYVKNRAGKLYTAVIMINSSKAKYRGTKLQNEILEWLAKSKAEPTVKAPSRTVQQTKSSSQNLFGDIQTNVPAPMQKVKETSVPKYYIQAGAFSKMPDHGYLGKINALGFRYRVHHSGSYKVLIGAYGDEKGARAALKKVRAEISQGAFIVKL